MLLVDPAPAIRLFLGLAPQGATPRDLGIEHLRHFEPHFRLHFLRHRRTRLVTFEMFAMTGTLTPADA